MLPADKQWPSQHLIYLENRAVSHAKDIKLVDLHGRPGWVAVSMASQASQDYVLAKGKPVELFIGRATSVHVFGCPVSLCDDSLLAAFCVHGKVFGIPKRQTIEFEGNDIETASRYVTAVLRTSVPSSVQIGNYRPQTWYKGQVHAWWSCNNADHEANSCLERGQRQRTGG